MKRLALLFALCSTAVFAQPLTVQMVHPRVTSACQIETNDCVVIWSESRILKITAPAAGATAYQIFITTEGKNGERRTWEYVTPRAERRYGELTAARSSVPQSATFFTLPLDLDIPILDISVTALTTSGEPVRQVPVN